MSKHCKLLVLGAASLALCACGPKTDGGTSSDGSSSSLPSVEGWDEDAKALLEEYCGGLLPYPASFYSDVYVTEAEDGDENDCLMIFCADSSFTIADYHESLEAFGWDCIVNYNGEAGQINNNGTLYYELTKVSSDGKTGYDLLYYFYESEEGNYNIIQCYNDLETDLDGKADWNESQKEAFSSTLSIVPAKVKLGADGYVSALTNDFSYVHDLCAINLTADNVEILKGDGWALDEKLSQESGKWTFEKKAADGAPIYATVYYSSGNYVTFSYTADFQESASWPKEFLSSFEKQTGFTIPEFTASDIKKYYYCTKKGISYIFAYTENDSLSATYEGLLNENGAIFDSSRRFFTDWEENWWIECEATRDYDLGTYEKIFVVSFAVLSEPYDDLCASWPSDKIASFLSANGMAGVEVPSFDVLPNGEQKPLRVSTKNFDEAYKEAYENVSTDPDAYGLSEEASDGEIEETARKIAKNDVSIAIKAYDPKDASEDTRKTYEYLKSALKGIGWAKVSSYAYDAAYEDPTGSVLVGLTRNNDITSLVFSHGSGVAHQPAFYFETVNMSAEAGKTYSLDLVCDMLSGEITYSSSNEGKFAVSQDGLVSVSSSAERGDSATITATIKAEGEEAARTATCFISIPESYDLKKTAYKIAELYNAYFNLDSSDEGYATPSLINEKKESAGYSLTIYPPTVNTAEEGKSFVVANLIPVGFATAGDDAWQSGSSKELGDYQWFCCDYFNDDSAVEDVEVTFKVFTSKDGSIGVKVLIQKF